MLRLTDEILVEICKNLSDKELCTVSQCCKVLRRVSEDNALWQIKWEKYEEWWGSLSKRGN
jgi:hypothetical protein